MSEPERATPRRLNARRRPSVAVVLPLPERGAAIMSPRVTFGPYRFRPLANGRLNHGRTFGSSRRNRRLVRRFPESPMPSGTTTKQRCVLVQPKSLFYTAASIARARTSLRGAISGSCSLAGLGRAMGSNRPCAGVAFLLMLLCHWRFHPQGGITGMRCAPLAGAIPRLPPQL
jgi:hypothetical protein